MNIPTEVMVVWPGGRVEMFVPELEQEAIQDLMDRIERGRVPATGATVVSTFVKPLDVGTRGFDWTGTQSEQFLTLAGLYRFLSELLG